MQVTAPRNRTEVRAHLIAELAYLASVKPESHSYYATGWGQIVFCVCGRHTADIILGIED